MIKCPYCKSIKTKCYGGIKTYLREDNVYVRYRKCTGCGRTFNTEESYVPDDDVKKISAEQREKKRSERNGKYTRVRRRADASVSK